ncbi:hypothetical protein GCM10023350_14860 [Nocardioides endophyticus]|uniref:Uncharacterized protein n=1 Tax=Nocardioides endophyticus TaxID=1353775 RepID=A0ABP8YJY7_9ACTN
MVRAEGKDARWVSARGLPSFFRVPTLNDPWSATQQPVPLSRFLPDPSVPVQPPAIESARNEGSGLQLRDAVISGAVGDAPVMAAAATACSLNYTSWNDFSFWNGSRQSISHCYCYAANYSPGMFGTPGVAGGNNGIRSRTPYASDRPTATQFANALKADGWKESCTGASLCIVAYLGKITDRASGNVVFWDFHFYRKNLNGSAVRWCHKPGSRTARNTDSSGNYITAPVDANRTTIDGPYEIHYGENVGTFYSPAGTRSVVISG